ncbi:hypothetical protein AALB_3527 [Agarivorans albus MKT 106]|uniref:Uncharacterized protein n=1 Tax=Agarivorans albus MKT 106 TaxID=1331007 RepID=R9PPX8_AGAAL|nr:hypothetical protein AALB_3527 [Agarivorans albus MKT 106]
MVDELISVNIRQAFIHGGLRPESLSYKKIVKLNKWVMKAKN